MLELGARVREGLPQVPHFVLRVGRRLHALQGKGLVVNLDGVEELGVSRLGRLRRSVAAAAAKIEHLRAMAAVGA